METRSRPLFIKIVICALGLATAKPAIADESLADATQRVHVETLIAEYFPDHYPTMLAVASCESTGLIHREPNGELKRNENGSPARGVFQVEMNVHRSEMRRLGLDPNNDDDYMTYVRLLYNKHGLAPWKESKHCWKKRVKT